MWADLLSWQGAALGLTHPQSAGPSPAMHDMALSAFSAGTWQDRRMHSHSTLLLLTMLDASRTSSRYQSQPLTLSRKLR